MGQNSSKHFTPEDTSNIKKILTEQPNFTDPAEDISIPPRMTMHEDETSQTALAIRETNKALEFAKDLLVLYSQPAKEGVNFNTTNLLAINSTTLGQANPISASQLSMVNSISTTRSQQDPVKLGVKRIINQTQDSGSQLKEVIKIIEREKPAKFSFARQRMDFHVEPAKFSRAVGSHMGTSKRSDNSSYGQNSSIYRGGRESNDLNESQKYAPYGSNPYKQEPREREMMEPQSQQYSPYRMKESGSSQKFVSFESNSYKQQPKDSRDQRETRDTTREVIEPQQQPQRYLPKQQQSIREEEQPEPPKFGKLWKDKEKDRENKDKMERLEQTLDAIRRAKKEKDGRTHESLIILKDDVDRIKYDLDRSKNSRQEGGKDPNRYAERSERRMNNERTPPPGYNNNNNYPEQNRDNQYNNDIEYNNGGYREREREMYSLPQRQEPRGYDQYENNNRDPQPQQQYNNNQGAKNSFTSREVPQQSQSSFQRYEQTKRERSELQKTNPDGFYGQPIENSRHKLYSQRPSPPKERYVPERPERNEIQGFQYDPREQVRSQSPINDRSGYEPSGYERGVLEKKPTVYSKGIDPFNDPKVLQKKAEDRSMSQYTNTNSYYRNENRPYVGQFQGPVPVENYKSQNQRNNVYPPNPQQYTSNASPHSQRINQQPQSINNNHNNRQQQQQQYPGPEDNNILQKLNNSKQNYSDMQGSYSLEEENDGPVSIDLNLEDLLNDSNLADQRIKQLQGKGYQQNPQGGNQGRNRDPKYNNYPNTAPNRGDGPGPNYYPSNQGGNTQAYNKYLRQGMQNLQNGNSGDFANSSNQGRNFMQNGQKIPITQIQQFERPKTTQGQYYPPNDDRRNYGQYPSQYQQQQDRYTGPQQNNYPQQQQQQQQQQIQTERNESYRKSRWNERSEMPSYNQYQPKNEMPSYNNNQYQPRNQMMMGIPGYNGSQSARVYQ